MIDYLNETIDLYNSLADSYAKQALDHGPVMQRKLFASLITKGGKILDVGCGSGRDSTFFSEEGFKVIGLDISEKLLEIARVAAPKAKFYSADMRHLSFEKEMFDGIWSCASIVHIKHKEIPDVLKGFYSMLKSGGVLYIHAKKGEGESYIEEPSMPGKKRFYSFFTAPLLKKYCEEAGFSDIEVIDVGLTKAYADGRQSKEWVDCFAKKI